jgi:ribosomal protein S12 methylthiotransferase accessory factor
MIFVTEDGQIGSAVLGLLQKIAGPRMVSSVTKLAMPSPNDFLIAASDSYGFTALRYWERLCRLWKLSFLNIHVHNGEAIIGPLIHPNQRGCLRCWYKRYYSGRANARKFSGDSAVPNSPDPWVSTTTASLVAEIASQRVLETLARKSDRAHDATLPVYSFDLRKLTGKQWHLLPDSSCSCAQPPFDSASAANLELRSCPKLQPKSDRTRDIREQADVINGIYLGQGGIVSGLSIPWRFHPCALAATNVDLLGNGRLEICAGQSSRYSTARIVAIIEAIERYTSAMPRGRRVAVHATVNSLGDLALNPRLFGLYSEEQYKNHVDLLTPYSDDLELDFVWAFSLQKQKPVLIPRHLGFYSFVGAKNEPAFVIEGSNGCAIGNCPEEAIFHALLEVIERDAFLLAWYAQKTLRRFNLMDSTDPEVRCRVRILESQGFQVEAFDTTTEFGIPAVCVLAIRNDNEMPSVVCTPGAHLYPELAVKKAIQELTSMTNRLRIDSTNRDVLRRIDELAEDVTQAKDAWEHLLCYCSPASRHYFDFFLRSTQATSLQNIAEYSRDLWSEDLGTELQLLIKRVLAQNLDVVVVNHTSPEHSLARLCNYKVLVPGTVPIGWGGRLQRFEGVARLQAALKNNVPNPAPHPFA